MIKLYLLLLFLLPFVLTRAQVPVDLSAFDSKSSSAVSVKGGLLRVTWDAGGVQKARLLIDLEPGKPVFRSIQLSRGGKFMEIAGNLDPVFVLTVGKRDLISQNGWNIFFDKVPLKPFRTGLIAVDKKQAAVRSMGTRTVITLSSLQAESFTGNLEITVYEGTPLWNVSAVMSTGIDSTAIVYDAGLVSKDPGWENVLWSDPFRSIQSVPFSALVKSTDLAVKYRTIVGVGKAGSLALFPPPHQYFYPLDECFNLKFTWYGRNYRDVVGGYGIGIRQDLYGDRRFVPWFNAPPGTEQRLNFFCFLSTERQGNILEAVKRFTNGDKYASLPGYQTMSSHFHVEHTRNVLENKAATGTPDFVNVFKQTGVNIVHLAEFHGPGHPKGPEKERFRELTTLSDECRRLSDNQFLLLPGEEPNNFFGGHWLSFFPNPVNWVMSRKADEPFMSADPVYGKVYRVGSKDDMLQLLQLEDGLAWTAHARTKGSTGYPDAYRDEVFYKSDRFLGAAWKAMPADLSQPRLGKRILDLMDDMANWGMKKYVIAESDLFQIEEDFELYAHLNVNYLQLDKLPAFDAGWKQVLDVMKSGRFFVSTGEVLIPSFAVNGKGAGETVMSRDGKLSVDFSVSWTFPLHFAEVISGDGKEVYRHRIDLSDTKAFGSRQLSLPLDMKNRKWLRLEVWDVAANGAFTQPVWLE